MILTMLTVGYLGVYSLLGGILSYTMMQKGNGLVNFICGTVIGFGTGIVSPFIGIHNWLFSS